ncbi:MAG: DNA-binding protein [Candidatus Aenigmatarchaeota archaeon]|nr:MAG: DNA-binding protein [Candidatus Aenigmarchaeota archaeon]
MTHAGARAVRFLLDTNFLMIPGKFKVDVFEQLRGFGKYSLYTLDLVLRELERLALGSGKDSGHARVALQMLRKNGVAVLPTDREGHTDMAIRRIAAKRHYTVCTQDRELIKKLRKDRVPVITMRQGRYLKKVD